MKSAVTKVIVASFGFIVWGFGRYGTRNLESFSWPQEVAILVTNVGIIIIGTAIVSFLWELMRSSGDG